MSIPYGVLVVLVKLAVGALLLFFTVMTLDDSARGRWTRAEWIGLGVTAFLLLILGGLK